ncbi:MAG: NYN domain-containing protein [Ignavibacteriaceae bacterium]|nr:NYN domain-containing protein [Ignavibacterium sp.]MCC6254527.1 NYN domain-containing protein [Ignavibacteriaceae bacterium]HRN25493.1 NYN domain-containing protein [Ignavibacteriaceae bacterium]HRP92384.1 NYN domain-containing protein [Ignavibacteriaceae bacterium]HRQ53539.1 NYN domain-containing protein [Ignavibacteriaceae bacterium]
MLNYIIDGNNLIGKVASLKSLQNKDKHASREKLVFMLDRFFITKKANVTLHLDGYPNEKINSSKMKIIYSENLTADEKIKKQISQSKSPRNIIVITSDSNLAQFAKVCSATVTSSELFVAEINKSSSSADEETIIKSMNNIDEFKKLFGVDDK